MSKRSKLTATTPALSRLLNNIQPYYRKIDVDKNILKVAAKTRRKWEGWLIESIDDFANYFKPNHGLNYYQVACLCLVADWKYKFPSIADIELFELIEENNDFFSMSQIMESTSNQSPKKSTELVKVA